jgi:hypothetical protein
MTADLPKGPRWHPQPAVYDSSTMQGSHMIDIYEFPCCGARVDQDENITEAPSQVQGNGCQPLPTK